MASQLVLPLAARSSLDRNDFIVAPCNAQAVAFVDSWPGWPVAVVAIYGPPGSGKTHLACAWRAISGAQMLSASELAGAAIGLGPLVIEDVDAALPSDRFDALLFPLIERATHAAPVLMTAKEAPQNWKAELPDLRSRYSAMLSLPLWAPDDELLAALARKLLGDRQVNVPDAVIERMLRMLERSPGAIREFIAKADAKSLSEARPINLAVVRELMAEEEAGLS